jgi:hypothetical protein
MNLIPFNLKETIMDCNQKLGEEKRRKEGEKV